MELINSFLLGLIQGVTEFLPISSSGHLIIFRDITNTQFDYGLAFDAVLQFATTLAILVYFRKDVINLIKNTFKLMKNKLDNKSDKILIFSIILGTIPAVILGFLLEEMMDTIFRNSLLVAGTLVFGAFIMYLADKFSNENKKLTIKNSIVIGFFQSLALIPGMSRSGMTISGGLLMGLSREMAIRFGFLLALPVLLGSGFKKIIDLGERGLLNSIGFEILIGSISAFIFGLLAINFLVNYLINNSFSIFIYYRLILALIIVSIYFI